MIKCNCGITKECNEKVDVKFEVIEKEFSKSNLDEWDIRLKLKCKKCGESFEYYD